ncbi:hypothetical protein GGI05_002902 [Coemansia sp. RSA 2603]|nr:hypothetical protein GGI05_002902 [Coemansia sp. RSA 2603]
MLLRVYNYIGIFMLNRRNTGIYFILPVAYVTSISIIYGVLAFVINPSSGYSYDPAINMCIVGTPIYIVGVVLLAIQGIIMCAMLVKARKMECCFHEYRNMIITFGVCIVAGIVIVVLRFVKIGSDGTATGILKMIFIFIPQQVYFYMILGVPIYHSIRNSEQYLTHFIDLVEGRGLSPVYEMAGKCSLGEISNMSEYNQSRTVSMQKRITGTSQFSGNVPAPNYVGNSSRHSSTTAREPNQESTFSYME